MLNMSFRVKTIEFIDNLDILRTIIGTIENNEEKEEKIKNEKNY